jgi:hypothetical protein
MQYVFLLVERILCVFVLVNPLRDAYIRFFLVGFSILNLL